MTASRFIVKIGRTRVRCLPLAAAAMVAGTPAPRAVAVPWPVTRAQDTAALAGGDTAAVSGTIYLPAGLPAGGAHVQLTATVSDRTGVHSRPVGTAAVDAAAHYRIAYPAESTIADLARLDGGRVNWEVDATAGTAMAETVFPGRPPSPAAATGTVSARAVTATDRSQPVNLILQAARTTARSTGGGPSAVSVPGDPICPPVWVTDSSEQRNVIIGEPRAGFADTVELNYPQGASITIGVALSLDGSSWSDGASASVTSTTTSTYLRRNAPRRRVVVTRKARHD